MSTKYGLQVESIYTLAEFQPVILFVPKGDKKVIDRGGVSGLLAIKVEEGGTLEYIESVQQPGLFHTYIYLEGENSSVNVVSKVEVSSGVIDISHKIFHSASSTSSNISTKGVLSQTAQLIYTSEIRAEGDFLDISGKEKAQFLISDDARVSGIPELNIYTDSISCAHSFSVAPIPDSQISYMCTKGYDKVQAKKIIEQAFLDL